MQLTFYISAGQLVYSDAGKTFGIPASSGYGNCMNELRCTHLKNVGPIPKGRYFLLSQEFSDPHLLRDIMRNLKADWGDWRVRLYPYPEIATHGRDDFFLHCGTQKGSKGCIDVGGGILGNKSTDHLKDALLRFAKSDLLVV